MSFFHTPTAAGLEQLQANVGTQQQWPSQQYDTKQQQKQQH